MSRFILTVLGRAGSGKTTLINSIVAHLPRPVVIADTMGDFTAGLRYTSYESFAQSSREGKPNRSGVYIVRLQSEQEADMLLNAMVRRAKPATLIVDEASKFASPYYIHPALKDAIAYGRHWGLNLVFAARRTAEISRDITAQSDVIVSFKQTEPRDVKTLSQIWSEAEHLPNLDYDAHEHLIFTDRMPDALKGLLTP